MTPYYSRNGITIYCGDCLEVMPQVIEDNQIDLTVTSPPYDDLREYNGYTFDFEPIAQQLWRVTKPGGVVVETSRYRRPPLRIVSPRAIQGS